MDLFNEIELNIDESSEQVMEEPPRKENQKWEECR